MIETETIKRVLSSKFYRCHGVLQHSGHTFWVLTGAVNSHRPLERHEGNSWDEVFDKALLSVITLRLTS